MPLDLLLDSPEGRDVLQGHIFPFLGGLGLYRTVGAINRAAQETYLEYCRANSNRDVRFTRPDVLLSSRSCVDLYMSDLGDRVPTEGERTKLFPFKIIHPKDPSFSLKLFRVHFSQTYGFW